METISFRATDEEAQRARLMAALEVEMPDGISSVLREGLAMAWAKYGRLAEVMADAKARARAEAAKLKADSLPRITKIGDTEITINDDGDVMYADLVIENAEGKWYGVHLGGDDWDYLQDNGEYIPVREGHAQ